MLGRRRRDIPAGPPAAAAEELLAENLRLKRAVEELSTINEIARAIGASRSSERVMDELVKRTRGAVKAEQVVVSLLEPQEGGGLHTVMRDKSQAASREFRLSEGLVGMMAHLRAPFLSNDPTRDPALAGLRFDFDLRSLICAPLMVRGKVTGALAACNKRGGGGFEEDDLRLLGIIAMQSAQILENARLSEEEAAFAVMQKEVELAREIQLGLVPQEALAADGYDLVGRSLPAQQVGGDYFDYFPLEERRIAVCLGDVSGKGIPASLLMANLQATLRGQARLNPDARDCIVWSNRLLYRSTSPEKFATLFYGVLDVDRHLLQYCNAGHERPLLLPGSGGEPQRLATGGLMLAVLDEFAYQSETVPLGPGDLLVAFSDGVTDALDAEGRPFGEEGLLATLAGLRDRPAAEVAAGIMAAVGAHAGSEPQMDDVTLLVLRRRAGS